MTPRAPAIATAFLAGLGLTGCAHRSPSGPRPRAPEAVAGPSITLHSPIEPPVRPGPTETVATASASTHARDAMAAVEARDYAAAARHFEAAYAAVHSVELAFNTARMYERLADVPLATRWYNVVLAHEPSPALRADVTRRLASLQAFARRRRDDIAQSFPGTEALAREATRWFARGVALYQRRRYAPALRAFEAANQYVQGDGVPELMYNLGMTHTRLGHNAEAISAFRAYLAARPDAPERTDIEARIRTLAP